jgi:aminopeptidase N
VPLALDGDERALTALHLDGEPLAASAYVAGPSSLTISDPPRRPFKLRIETQLDPAANTKLMGLYRSGSAYCTQCEAEGFRRITYFLDRPDVLSVYRVRLEADKIEAPVLLSNGNLESTGDFGSGRHYAVWNDPFKKPSYLFALVAGDLARVGGEFVTASGRRVELGIYVEPGRESRADYALDALKRSMAWDERAYGREYDLDVFNIVAVSDFNMGAMENKGLNVFNDKYVLASAATATDEDYAGIEGVIAHEYFHNWTGNRITCRRSRPEVRAISRRRRAARAQRPARGLSRDQQLLHGHRLPEGRGSHPHAQGADRRLRVSRRDGSLFPALRRHSCDGRGFSGLLRRSLGP